jgi:hypothetical protein
MQTSNYATCGKHPDAVSIAGWPPPWWTGRQYKKLAPKRWFFDDYKRTGDSNKYTVEFYEHVLKHLDPQQVFEELGENAILLCYEKPGDFCHRCLSARWFETELGILVPEYNSDPHAIL